MTIDEYKEKYSLYKEASKAYYNGNPIITDEEFDKLFKEVEGYYTENKEALDKLGLSIELIEDSEGFEKRPHNFPMMSLQDVFNDEDMYSKLESISEAMPIDEYAVSYKFDGLPIDLQYENGKLVSAVTRGDGYIGDDVFKNAIHVSGVLRTLPRDITISVRGEVVLPYKGMEKVNEYRIKNGQSPLSNPRNGAVGLLKKETVIKEQLKHLLFMPWEKSEPTKDDEYVMDMWLLQDLGFKINVPNIVKGIDNKEIAEGIKRVYDARYRVRDRLPYMVDGLVIRVNDNNSFLSLGITSKYFKGAFAYKFPHVEHTTIVRDVIWQVGRTGIVTPKAKVDSVNIDGVNVEYVTLHNHNYIKELGLSIEDKIGIIRSGDVIPKITKVYEKSNNPPIEPIRVCPSCNSKLFIDDNSIYCTNEECRDMNIEKLTYAVSKPALNVDGLSKANITKLYDAGKISAISDIFKLTKKDLDEVIGGKTGDNIFNAIDKAKHTDMYRYLVALQIPNVGPSTAKAIVKYYKGDIGLIDTRTLVRIDGIDTRTANGILDYIIDYTDWNVLYKQLEFKPLENNLSKKMCITGKFSMRRSEIVDLSKDYGYEVVNSVSKNINLLLVGDDPSESKIEKAKKLGIKIAYSTDEI